MNIVGHKQANSLLFQGSVSILWMLVQGIAVNVYKETDLVGTLVLFKMVCRIIRIRIVHTKQTNQDAKIRMRLSVMLYYTYISCLVCFCQCDQKWIVSISYVYSELISNILVGKNSSLTESMFRDGFE
jgi:hypothetical protein